MIEFIIGLTTTIVGIAVVVLVIVTVKWMIETGLMEFLVILGLILALLWGVVQVSKETGKWVMETGTKQVRSYLNEDS